MQKWLDWLKKLGGEPQSRPEDAQAAQLARLLIHCPQCGFDNWPGMAYCGHCGTRLRVECANCGFANPQAHRFCGQCGRALVASEAVSFVDESQVLERAYMPDGSVEPRPVVEPRLQGERRSVTVLIADVKGSTQLLERIGTESWVEVMNYVLQLLEAEIYRYGGQVNQFRGDGLVAFFGVSSAHEDDPERAVLAALAMQESVKAYAHGLNEQQGIDLLVRIGLNTGEVIVTNIGDSSQHNEDTAMGEAISLAARMEAAAEPGTVLVSENTYHIVASHFRWQPLGQVTVKGLSTEVSVYRPLAPISDVEWASRLHAYGLQSALVGRQQEVETFKQLIFGLSEGRGGILTLTGDKGMGKSFLVTQVRQRFIHQDALLAQVSWKTLDGTAGAHSVLTWIQVRCRSYEQSRPYSLWINLLRRWLEMSEEEPVLKARERLRERCESLWPESWQEHYPYLAVLLSMPVEDEVSSLLLEGYAEGIRQQLFLSLQSWVQELARRGPLVLAFGDMHWIDATSLDVLKYGLSVCERESLLWVLVFRPERTSIVWPFRYHLETEYPHRLTAIHLSALGEQDSCELIDQLIGPEVLPVETRDLIVRTAEGNPYYLREFVYSLIRQGVLVQEAITSQWHATRAVNALKLPDTLQSLLLARIDGLSAEERRVLQVAAVIGSVFWENVLRELLDSTGRADLHTHLTALERAQLIYEGSRVPVLGQEYIFKSTLICDAAYDSMLQLERVIYHRQVAEYLAQFVDGSRNASILAVMAIKSSSYDNLISFSLVAYHYRLAQVFDKELWYARAAAAQAQQVYANAEALDLNKRVLELLDQMEEKEASFETLYPEETGSWSGWRLDALVGQGQVCFGMGRLDQAEESFRRAIAVGQACALPVHELVRLYYWLAESLYWQDRYDEQIEIGECGLALLAGKENTLELALMNLELASGYNMKGDGTKFCEFASITAQLVRQLPYSEELRPAYYHIAIMNAYWYKQVGEALDWLQMLEQASFQHHDLRALGEAQLVRGEIAARQGNLQQAVLMQQQALRLFERIRDVKHESWCLSMLSRTCLALGDLEQAQAFALRGLESAQQTGSRRFIKSAYWSLSSIYICRNDKTQAIESLQQVIDFSRETGDAQGMLWANRALGQLYLEQGEIQRATQHLHDALGAVDHDLANQQPSDLAVLSRKLESVYNHQDVLQLFYRLGRQTGLSCVFGEHCLLQVAQVTDSPEPGQTICQAPLNLDAPEWTWIDPLGDCTIVAQGGIEIHTANGRDLWHINLSAPRLLRSVLGTWAMQCRCVAYSDETPAIGGLLVWQDEHNYVRLDWGVRGMPYVVLMGCLGGQDTVLAHVQVSALPLTGLWLRLEGTNEQISAFCSVDGELWSGTGRADLAAGQEAVQIGLYGIGLIDRSVYHGAFSQGTAMCFESFKLWRV
ncbi:MAG: AAA family ATPase [Anaerolineae bacterium]|nr:AAA family ATPase [Anaerolineae bacterium]